MGATEQISILAAVQRLSFPKGIGPFIEQVNQMMGSTMPPIESVLHAQSGMQSSKSTNQVACSLQRLIANGHSRDAAWASTPRQLMAWCGLIERERARVMAQDYESLRYSQAENGPANKYHDQLLSYAAGKSEQ